MESAPAGCNDKARRKTLYVPLKRSGQSFVKVVDVEDNVSLRCGEAAEIHQMTIAAGMDIDTAHWRAGQIVSLYQCGPSKIREWRLQHSPIAKRNEILQPLLARLF